MYPLLHPLSILRTLPGGILTKRSERIMKEMIFAASAAESSWQTGSIHQKQEETANAVLAA